MELVSYAGYSKNSLVFQSTTAATTTTIIIILTLMRIIIRKNLRFGPNILYLDINDFLRVLEL
jgi:hypothetical protein